MFKTSIDFDLLGACLLGLVLGAMLAHAVLGAA